MLFRKLSVLASFCGLVSSSAALATNARFDEYKCQDSKSLFRISVYSQGPDYSRHLEVINSATGKTARGVATERSSSSGLRLQIPGYDWMVLGTYDDGNYDGVPSVLVRFNAQGKLSRIVCQFYGW